MSDEAKEVLAVMGSIFGGFIAFILAISLVVHWQRTEDVNRCIKLHEAGLTMEQCKEIKEKK